ncbi:MAG: AtpZ/AtpI family protein [Alphaproteobacteria bacterium]|nr:AtpZ/AtpI family protein [Alphaproteobacteria bacterium]
MSDAPDPKALDDLAARINAAKAVKAPAHRHVDHSTAARGAWRMVIELVVGVGLGFGIGYGLDGLFGTIPIFLILFTLLGFAAGIRTMMRSAAEIQAENAKAAEKAKAEE